MVEAAFNVVIIAFLIWLVAKNEGSVILEDLLDPISLVAFLLASLAIIFAFVMPDLQGHHVHRGAFKLYSCLILFGLGCTIFPGATTQKELILMSIQNWRRLGLIILTFALCLSLLFSLIQ